MLAWMCWCHFKRVTTFQTAHLSELMERQQEIAHALSQRAPQGSCGARFVKRKRKMLKKLWIGPSHRKFISGEYISTVWVDQSLAPYWRDSVFEPDQSAYTEKGPLGYTEQCFNTYLGAGGGGRKEWNKVPLSMDFCSVFAKGLLFYSHTN